MSAAPQPTPAAPTPATPTAPALDVRDLTKRYGGVRALDGISFTVGHGELVGLIGPNGSGKSTAIDCITGFTRPTSGTVTIAGRPQRTPTPQRAVRRGLARTFQAVRVFGTLSVRDNVLLGGFAGQPGGPLAYLRNASADSRQRADRVVEEFMLAHVAGQPAGEISYGQRKLVEFAAAVMREPTLLLLDEPVAAVNLRLAEVMKENIRRLHATGVSVLLVEHNMEFVVETCERVVVLDQGRVLASGPAREVMARDDVKEAYFGHD